MITQERLKELLHYNPDTGIFTWLVDRGRLAKKGDESGCTKSDGYIRIRLDGAGYYAHRLAFLYMEGDIPQEIDHIDRSRSNNSWGNLARTSRSRNMLNAGLYPSNKSGAKGVSAHKDGGFVANITVDKKRKYLGKFKTKEEAIQARSDAEKELL